MKIRNNIFNLDSFRYKTDEDKLDAFMALADYPTGSYNYSEWVSHCLTYLNSYIDSYIILEKEFENNYTEDKKEILNKLHNIQKNSFMFTIKDMMEQKDEDTKQHSR